jgi:hypothetical protein
VTPAERAVLLEIVKDALREVVPEVVGGVIQEQLLSAKGLMSDEEIATHLGIPTRSWKKIYEEYQPLAAIRYGMGNRGGGTEGRWNLAEVLKVLRARKRRR